MSNPYIVIGDKTSHGGTVISADFTYCINGKATARVGDQVVCPRCKGVFPITEGDPGSVDAAGKSYARRGDKTACGASLLPSQGQTVYKGHGGAGSGAGSAGNDAGAASKGMASEAIAVATKKIAVQTPTLCLECLIAAAAKGSTAVMRG
jgi:uncharacterized Zn-binding protein involved in type VI secretion